MAGKGDKNRTSDMKSYWESPLWDNLKKNKYDSYSEFSKDFTPLVEEHTQKRFLFLDDVRYPLNAWIYDENKKLSQVSGISNYVWDIVRSYDEFVTYIETNGVPDVVSFDNDLFEEVADLPEEEFNKSFRMIDWEKSPIKTGAHCAAWLMIDWEKSPIKTGAHCAAWLCEFCKKHQQPLPEYYIHSANIFARSIIRGIMESAKPLIKH